MKRRTGQTLIELFVLVFVLAIILAGAVVAGRRLGLVGYVLGGPIAIGSAYGAFQFLVLLERRRTPFTDSAGKQGASLRGLSPWGLAGPLQSSEVLETYWRRKWTSHRAFTVGIATEMVYRGQ